MPPKVFVSYAHTAEDHATRVGALVDRLRDAGLTVAADSDVVTPQGPPEGWPSWMLDRVDEADWVLVVCNAAYYRRFRGTEPSGQGLGARWEGAIIGHALYMEGSRNRKFVPLLLHDEPLTSIPEPLRGSTHYRIPAELPKLMKALGRQPPPGRPKTFPGTRQVDRRRPARSAMARHPVRALAGLLAVALLVFAVDRVAMTRRPANFALTVYVHEVAGTQEVPLRARGATVFLDVGGDRRSQVLGDKGETVFAEIPASFRGQSVPLWAEAPGYQLVGTRSRRLKGTSVYLKVQRKPVLVKGNVTDEAGNPIGGAAVSIAGITVRSTSNGYFELLVPPSELDAELLLQVIAEGYEPWHYGVVPNGGATTAVLVRKS